MKKVNFLLLSFAFVGSFLLTSCSKEAKIEKNLWNKGGEWSIESLTVNQTSTYAPDNYTETIVNAGTFFFKEDGAGTYTFTVDGDVESGLFTYSNTENQLTFIVDGDVRLFDIVEWEKNKLKISISETYQSDGETVNYSETYNLEKK